MLDESWEKYPRTSWFKAVVGWIGGLFVVLAPTSILGQGNVIVFVADDLGTDKILSYRSDCTDRTGPCSDVPETPFLDARAVDGVQFENTWSNPVCSPTRSTILTGLYAGRTGILAGVGKTSIGLVEDDWTFPEMIAAVNLEARDASADYRTAAFGKWHLNGEESQAPDQDAGEAAPIIYGGFDYFEGTMASIGRESLLESYCDYGWWTVERDPITGEATEPVPRRQQKYSTSQAVDRALAWIYQNSDQPWVVYVAFHAPHDPFHRLDLVSSDTHPLTGIVSNNYACGTLCERDDPYDTLAAECLGPSIEAIDDEVRRLWEWLEVFDEMEIAELPTAFFVGDNGTDNAGIDPDVFPANNVDCDPGPCVDRFTKPHGKTTVFEGGIRVPLLAWGAGVSTSGPLDHLVSTADFFTTIADLIGFEGDLTTLPGAPSSFDSHSFAPLLADGVSCPPEGCRSEILAEVRGVLAEGPLFSYAYRTQEAGVEYKLVRGCLECSLADCNIVDCADQDCVYRLTDVDGRKELIPLVAPDPIILEALESGIGDLLADLYPDFDAATDRCPTAFN